MPLALHSENMPNHALYAGVLGVIVLSLLTVSLSRLNKTKTKADYLVAGRSLPAFVLVFTLLLSWIGSGSLLGGAENAYNHGFAALWQAGGGRAGLLLIYFIAPRARKFAQFTIPDLLEARYNQTARVRGVIAILFAYTAITSYQLIGGGDILHLIFPTIITADLGKYMIAVFVIAFTAIAGMASVAYMDAVIGLLATVTLVLSLPLCCTQPADGARLPRLCLSHTSRYWVIQPGTGIGTVSADHAADAGQPVDVSKVLFGQSEDARNAVVGWIIGTIILETVIVALAVFGSVLFLTGEVHQRPREIIAYTALHGLPAWLGALLMGAVFARLSPRQTTIFFRRRRTW